MASKSVSKAHVSTHARIPQFAAQAVSGKVSADVVLIEEGRPAAGGAKIYAQTIKKLSSDKIFSASAKASQFVRFGGKRSAHSVLFHGLGKLKDLTEDGARIIGAQAAKRLVSERCATANCILDALTSAAHIHAFIEGFALSLYDFREYKTVASSKPESEPFKITKVGISIADKTLKAQLPAIIKQVNATALAVAVTRDWSNHPSNFGTPEFYASESKRICAELGIKYRVLDQAEIKREKMELLLAVSQGSDRPCRVVIAEYSPKKPDSSTKHIAFVGKGVTFDSGGISIKPASGMEEMKHDMTGAATVFGVVSLAAMLEVPHRVTVVLALTENMPGGDAVQPGNVVKGRSGKTVEIINTDAEGRLILADVIDYAHDLKPDLIIDVATLTGAVSIALGKQSCAILGNNQALIDRLIQCGESTRERMWQLPLWDEHRKELESHIADIKNVSNTRNAGVIKGAVFIEAFVKKNMPWAHLDIACTAWDLGHIPYYPRFGASGKYVRALTKFVAEYK